MKKHILLSMMIFILFFSCQDRGSDGSSVSGSEGGPIELRFSWWGGDERHEATLKAVEAFQVKYPNITVKSEYGGWAGWLEKVTTQVAGNTEPDLLQVNWNWLPIFSASGTGFYDLNEVSDVLDLSQFDRSALESGTVDGHLNGIATSMNGRIFYWNQQTFERAGLEYPTTWDELFMTAEVFQRDLGENYYPLMLAPHDAIALLNSYMIQKYNIGMIDVENKSLEYTKDQLLDLFTFYQELVARKVTPNTSLYTSFGNVDQYEYRPWMDGEFAGVLMWPSSLGIYAATLAEGTSLELGPYIMSEGATDSGTYYKPTLLLSISKNTKYPREAALLLDFLLNDPDAIDILGTTRGEPLSKKAFARLEQTGKLVGLASQGMQQINEIPKVVVNTSYMDDPKLVELFTVTFQELDSNLLTVQAATDKFYDEANFILSEAIK